MYSEDSRTTHRGCRGICLLELSGLYFGTQQFDSREVGGEEPVSGQLSVVCGGKWREQKISEEL